MPATFATAITCIDGRVHAPLAEWVDAHGRVTAVAVECPPDDECRPTPISSRLTRGVSHVPAQS